MEKDLEVGDLLTDEIDPKGYSYQHIELIPKQIQSNELNPLHTSSHQHQPSHQPSHQQHQPHPHQQSHQGEGPHHSNASSSSFPGDENGTYDVVTCHYS